MSFDRKFHWVSSSKTQYQSQLKELDAAMHRFYSELNKRSSYQALLDVVDNDLENPGLATLAFLEFLVNSGAKDILEVGCGNARIYKNIKNLNLAINYLGIEVSEDVIAKNALNFPEANWVKAGAYQIPAEDDSVDICFSFYVLEHLVYPEKALKEMLRVVKPGGNLVLIFPDFVASQRFASQRLGLSYLSTAKESFKKGEFLDGLISLYDSRVKLPYHLKNVKKLYGDFVINLKPKCLDPKLPKIGPDVDAVYVASKKEIKNWAIENGYKITSPAGETGYFNEHAFIAICKP